MGNKGGILLGQVYYCPVCRAEVTVIRAGEGALGPRCCNQPMELKSRLSKVYYCPVCGAEVMVIRESSGVLALRCCNQKMRLKVRRTK